jgi:two-component system NarL family response regulator
MRQLSDAAAAPAEASGSDASDGLALLTPREREVLEAMARGLSNREIAGELGIGLGTVRVHGHAIMQKLEVTNRTQAVLKLLPGLGSTP